MPAMQGRPRFDEISRQWLDLAERRLAHFIELYRSGRWQHYYTTENFAVQLRDVIRAVTIWKRLAGQAPAPAADKNDLRPAA
jgi:uncharacterized repeat protein (TIGR03809 family)